MRKILIPVDFSHNSNNALEYAARFASDTEGGLVLMHALEHLPVSEMDAVGAAGFKQRMEADYQDAQEKLSGYCDEVTAEFSIGCNYVIHAMPLADAVDAELSADDYDLLILGTNGADNFYENLFGSTSYTVLKHVVVPVLVVPYDFSYKSLQQIVFATDFAEDDELKLAQLKDFLKSLASDLHVVHVQKSEAQSERLLKFEQRVKNIFPAEQAVVVETIMARNIPEAIETYATHNGADLLVVTTKNRSMVAELFHKSVIKRLCADAEFPLLVFHM